MYALIKFAGKQYKVEENSFIRVPRVQGKVGTKVAIEKILYLEDGDNKTVGSPFVAGKKLDGEIVSHGRGRKVVVFKFKRRKGYQTKNTHRDEYTILKFGKLKTATKQAAVKKADTPLPKKAVEKKEMKSKKGLNKSASSKTKIKKITTKKTPLKKTTETEKEKE